MGPSSPQKAHQEQGYEGLGDLCVWSWGCQMQTTQQQTSAKPDLSKEGPTRGKQYTWNGPHTSYSSCINQGTTIYIRHKWAWVIHKWPPAWMGLHRCIHSQLYGPDNWPCSEKMHISSSLHIAAVWEGKSRWNGSDVNAPRGCYYTRGYCWGTQLCTDRAHWRRLGSSTFRRLMGLWWARRVSMSTQKDHIWSKKH